MDSWTRRQLLLGSSVLTTGSLAASALGADPPAKNRQWKVLVAGAHPDDPESGCGGTIARYVERGHHVVVLYMTRGEAGIKGKSQEEAAAMRSAEAKKASASLNVRPFFAGQIDGATEVTPARYGAYRKILEAEKPDVLFTHWPIDIHPDHRAGSLLVYGAWLKTGRKSALYYFEVDLGVQTQCFRPRITSISRPLSRANGRPVWLMRVNRPPPASILPTTSRCTSIAEWRVASGWSKRLSTTNRVPTAACPTGRRHEATIH